MAARLSRRRNALTSPNRITVTAPAAFTFQNSDMESDHRLCHGPFITGPH